jgi:hypothetical protein
VTNDHGGYYPPPGGQPWGGPQGQPPGYPSHSGYPQKPPPRGKGRWPWLVGIGAAVVVVVVLAAVGLVVINSGGDDDRYDSHRTVVTYEVTGAAESVELIYQGAEGEIHAESVPLPWGETVTLEGEDAYFEVSAQTTDGSDQELACRVITYGTTLVEDRTIGGFVSCDGRVNGR